MCYLDIIASDLSPLFLFPAIAVLAIAVGILLLCGTVLVIVGLIREKKRKVSEAETAPTEEPQI